MPAGLVGVGTVSPKVISLGLDMSGGDEGGKGMIYAVVMVVWILYMKLVMLSGGWWVNSVCGDRSGVAMVRMWRERIRM